ncbi:MAG: hypothetical protein JW828_11280 [Sedimentisphaerales bacterium]|nr:hypothetical protein [Sedimentisphaerales bacterium]
MNVEQKKQGDIGIPILDTEFTANRYIGVFDILSLKVNFNFDTELSSATVNHFFVARKANTGPNGWCVPYVPGAHEYYRFYDEKGQEIPARVVQDANKHCYVVVDFRKNMHFGEIIKFKTETKQFVTSPMLQGENKRDKSLFLSRVYGSSCQDAELTITMPNTYTIIQSIPDLKRRKNLYTHRLQIVILEPVLIAIVVRRCLLPFVGQAFSRDNHPAFWAILGAFVGWILSKFL